MSLPDTSTMRAVSSEAQEKPSPLEVVGEDNAVSPELFEFTLIANMALEQNYSAKDNSVVQKGEIVLDQNVDENDISIVDPTINVSESLNALSFGEASVRPGLEAGHQITLRTINAHSEYNLNGGPILVMTEDEIEAKKNEEAAEYVSSMLEDAERKEKQEREEFEGRHNSSQSYAEWSESDQAFGEFILKGKGWEKLQSWLQKGDNKKQTENELKKKGYTDQQIADILRATKIMAKPPSEWTEEEREFIREKEKDQAIQSGIKTVDELSNKYSQNLDVKQSMTNIMDSEKSLAFRKSDKIEDTSKTISLDGVVSKSVWKKDEFKIHSPIGNSPATEMSSMAITTSVAATFQMDNKESFLSAPELRPEFLKATNPETETKKGLEVANASVSVPVKVVIDAGFG